MTDEPQPEPEDDLGPEPVGLVIIRAWIEPGSSEPLRAQVRLTTDVSAGLERTLTSSRVAEVGAAVEEWLLDMLSRAEG